MSVSLIAFGLPAAFGQNQENLIRTSFTGIRFGPPLEGLHYLEDRETSAEVTIPESVDSAVYDYVGTNPLVFFRESTNEDGEVVRTPVTRVTLPERAKRVLLFFFVKRSSSGEEVRVIALDDSETEFPAGEFKIWNLSGHPVAAQIASERAVVKAGERVSLSPSLDDQEYYPALMFFRPDPNADWKRFVSNGWTNRGEQRVLIILFPGGDEGKPPRMFVRANRPSN